MTYNNPNVATKITSLAVAAALGLLAAASTGKAETIPPVARYQLVISPDVLLAGDPYNSFYQQLAAITWDKNTLDSARDSPAIRLTNNSDAGIDLTNLRLDISIKSSYVFDAVRIVEAPPGFAPIFTTLSDIAQSGDSDPVFEMSFGNTPLRPGEFVTFYVELDAASGSFGQPLQDFRMVFWDRFDFFAGDNAVVSVQPASTAPGSPQLDPMVGHLFDYGVRNATYGPDPQEGTSGESHVVGACCGEQVDVYVFQQESTVDIHETPEPAGFLLAAFGAMGLAGYCWRRRRLRRNIR